MLNYQVVMIFCFKNDTKLLETGFNCSYPEVKDTNVMQNDRYLAE